MLHPAACIETQQEEGAPDQVSCLNVGHQRRKAGHTHTLRSPLWAGNDVRALSELKENGLKLQKQPRRRPRYKPLLLTAQQRP